MNTSCDSNESCLTLMNESCLVFMNESCDSNESCVTFMNESCLTFKNESSDSNASFLAFMNESYGTTYLKCKTFLLVITDVQYTTLQGGTSGGVELGG